MANMRENHIYRAIYYFLIVVYISACSNVVDSKDNKSASPQPLRKTPSDTILIKESSSLEDSSANGLLKDSLQLIRNNFKRINSIANWDKVYSKDLWDTPEGGEAKLYYKDSVLEKIVTRQYGETFQQLTEYYFLGGRLSFVFNKLYKYNRPIFFDSAAMKASGDTEVFDFKKSTVTEDRSYFKNGVLIQQLKNMPDDAVASPAYLQKEQERIYDEFNSILGQVNKK